jgi:hypothetical protein
MMPEPTRPAFASVEAVQEAFVRHNYIADRPLALTMKLAAELEKPVLHDLEGFTRHLTTLGVNQVGISTSVT